MSSTPGASVKRSATDAAGGDEQPCIGKPAPDVGDRGQRHHRVAEPVRRHARGSSRGVGVIVRDAVLEERLATAILGGVAFAPAAVHPQPQVRVPPHVHLEHVGAALRELADGVGCSDRGGSTGCS